MWQSFVPPFEFQTSGYATLGTRALKCWQPVGLFLIKEPKNPKDEIHLSALFYFSGDWITFFPGR